MSARLYAAKILQKIMIQNQAFDPKDPLLNKLSPPQQSKARYFCFSVLRHIFLLESLLNVLLKTPLKKKDADIEALLMIALFELVNLSPKPYAVVDETVSLARTLNKAWAKGLLNATLRRFLREREACLNQIQNDQEALYNHPTWFIKKIKKQWPNQWQSMLEANNQHPPMTLRVNQLKTDALTYKTMLEEKGLHASTHPFSPNTLILKEGINVDELPNFHDGWLSVQDLSAQFVPKLLDIKPRMKVLDACAAPGGKSAHLLETEPTLQLDAIDLNEFRINKLKATLKRLQLKAKIIMGDASNPETWWDKTFYDRILLDAPCTASGIIRRHPDIKLRCNKDLLKKTQNSQYALLSALWPLLKPNGILVYSTCSIFKEENVEQMERFLQENKDAKPLPIDTPWGISQTIGKQILPQLHMDGFYYARLKKLSS